MTLKVSTKAFGDPPENYLITVEHRTVLAETFSNMILFNINQSAYSPYSDHISGRRYFVASCRLSTKYLRTGVNTHTWSKPSPCLLIPREITRH